MLAKVHSATVLGIEGIPVSVEVDVANGLPAFTTVGLPDGSVRESKDRVKAAIRNCNYSFPNKKITVNLAPADLKKEGSAFDLPIALGLLVAEQIIPQEKLDDYLVIGELSLDGALRPVTGVLSIALSAADVDHKGIIVPIQNGEEAALVDGLEIIPARTLYEVVEILNDLRRPEPPVRNIGSGGENIFLQAFEEIKGQAHAKRALEVAVSGMHNIIMKGVPGSGKTMLARSLPSIMPDWSFEEQLETTRVYSVHSKNGNKASLITNRPFRAPHHTISDAGLIGGGSIPQPGEVSLAHNGVLFLDELPEFRKNVLEVLRQPLEDGMVNISRAQVSLSFPARFMLVAAMNPCPCGYHGDPKHECHCNDLQIQRYQNRISGPLLDRIDMHLHVGAIEFEQLSNGAQSERSSSIRKRVNRVRAIQKDRFHGLPGCHVNGQMGVKEIEAFCKIDSHSLKLLEKSVKSLGLSARAYHRILKLARTISDLEGSEKIQFGHVAEAIQYRREDI